MEHQWNIAGSTFDISELQMVKRSGREYYKLESHHQFFDGITVKKFPSLHKYAVCRHSIIKDSDSQIQKAKTFCAEKSRSDECPFLPTFP